MGASIGPTRLKLKIEFTGKLHVLPVFSFTVSMHTMLSKLYFHPKILESNQMCCCCLKFGCSLALLEKAGGQPNFLILPSEYGKMRPQYRHSDWENKTNNKTTATKGSGSRSNKPTMQWPKHLNSQMSFWTSLRQMSSYLRSYSILHYYCSLSCLLIALFTFYLHHRIQLLTIIIINDLCHFFISVHYTAYCRCLLYTYKSLDL